jgi:Na+/proline symporter
VLVLGYSGFLGFWGVVATDFFQFFLALLGAIIVAVVAVVNLGGMGSLIEQVQAVGGIELLAFVPLERSAGGWYRWSETAGISDATLDAFYSKVRPGGPSWAR